MNNNREQQLMAANFIAKHQGEHLSADRIKLIGRCIDHLMATLSLSRQTATVAALQAYAETQADVSRWRIDPALSTPVCLFLFNSDTGEQRIFFAPHFLPAESVLAAALVLN